MKECAIEMIHHKDFQHILPQIVSQKSYLLAKVLRNLSYFNEATNHQSQQNVHDSHENLSNTTKHIVSPNMLWQEHVITIIQTISSLLKSKNHDDGLLVELFYILSRIAQYNFSSTMSWSNLLSKYFSLYDAMIQMLRSCTLNCHHHLMFSIIETLLQVCVIDQKCIGDLSKRHSDILLLLYNALVYCKKHNFVETGLLLRLLALFHFFLHEPESAEILNSNAGT